MYYLGLIHNVALLVALAAGIQLLGKKLRKKPTAYQLIAGVLFGVTGILGMMTPVEFASGVIYDGRSIILSLAGLVCGPWALISAIFCGAYRLYLGGAGAIAGIAVVTEATLLGIVLFYLRQRDSRWVKPVFLYLFGVVVHIGMLALQFLVPDIDTMQLLRTVAPTVMLLFPLAFLVAAHFFLEVERHQEYEQALRESDERLSLSIEGGELGTWDWYIESGETVFNERWAEMFGYELSEIEQSVSTWEKLVHPDDMPAVQDALQAHLDGKTETYEIEHRVRHKSGRWVWVLDKGRVIERAKDGSPIRACGTHLDITQRKEAEAALRESAMRLQAAVAGGNVGLWDWDVHTNEVYYSPVWKEQIGYEDHEIGNSIKEWNSRLHPDDLDSAQETFRAAIDSGESTTEVEFRLRHKDGSYRWILSRASLIRGEHDEVLRMQGSHIDITQRKEDEQALRESQRRNAAMLEALPDLLFRIDGSGCFVDCHAASPSMLAIPVDQIIGRHAEELLPPDLADQMQEYITRALQSREVQTYDYSIDVTGETRHYEARMVPSADDEVLIIARDVTDKQRAESALHKSNQRYQEMIDNVIEGIAYTDCNRTIQYCNPAFAAILEASGPDELHGRYTHDFVPESEQEQLLEYYQRLRNGENIRWEVGLVTVKGNPKRIDLSVAPRFDDKGEYIGSFLAISDVTETRRLQELQSRAERLETAGTIAGQVAHDFNNLLAPMLAYPELIREELPRNHPALEFIDQIEKAAATIADINQDLLAMGRRGHYNKEVLNLNTVVQQAARELEPMPDKVVCDLELAHDLMDIHGGGAQIHRVVANLLHNALDALNGVGQISVKTENYYVDEVTIVYGRVPRGEYIKLTVSDTGSGIPDDIVQSIFDPFFTSKTANKRRGSGLGLSVVDAVVKDHDGYIDMETAVGSGTSFYVYLPVARAEAALPQEQSEAGGDEKILVVDDDAVQREVSTRLLQRLGYTTSVEESGEAAIELLRGEPHDLVILDMIMPPGIDGAETYRRICEFNPHQKAIIASGYSESERVQKAQQMGVGGFIKKPFTGKAIATAVRTELDRSPAAVKS